VLRNFIDFLKICDLKEILILFAVFSLMWLFLAGIVISALIYFVVKYILTGYLYIEQVVKNKE